MGPDYSVARIVDDGEIPWDAQRTPPNPGQGRARAKTGNPFGARDCAGYPGAQSSSNLTSRPAPKYRCGAPTPTFQLNSNLEGGSGEIERNPTLL